MQRASSARILVEDSPLSRPGADRLSRRKKVTVDHPIFARWPARYRDRLQLCSTSKPNGVKVGIMLEETSLAYEPHRIDIMANETQDPAFLALNPSGKSPAIYDPDQPSGSAPSRKKPA
ncbi:thioredoxin domain-containing protein [Bradyrhizobium sp. 23AC]